MIEDRIRSEEWNVVKLSNALKMTCVRLEVHQHKNGPILTNKAMASDSTIKCPRANNL